MSKIISITNQKGGVGKTTTAINIAASLAVAEKKVLLIDLDPQGNATSGGGINRTDLKSLIRPSELKYFMLIPATMDLIGAEIELIDEPERERMLKKAIAPLIEDFNFIILDCPPSLGLLTINALTAADSVIIPVQCEYYAMEGLSQILKT